MYVYHVRLICVFNLKHPIELAGGFGGVPAGGFVFGCLEIEEVFAEESEEQSHGRNEEKEEEGEEDFADDLADLEANHHATPIEATEPVWA